jgi:hypothetical protein
MGIGYNPRIVTNGLIMCVDAANPKSYPGSGTTWFDISGSGNHITLYNSPTFATNVFQFNGTNQYAENTLNLSTGTSTVMGAARYSGATRGRVISSKTNNWLLGHWGATTENFYAEGWVSAVYAGASDTNWRMLAGTHDVTADLYGLYLNGQLNVSNSGGSAGPNGISLGRWGGGSEYSTCEVSFVLAYNRVLTAAEIQQNFQALRGRYGI